ncbi:methionine ABC transporter ATP-binding protein [Actinobacteria bacterium YIM 96077]|uniref:Methionine ABC transporter ATP-binding protein n=1 Tax=Phytoactinopolyspora halophila TaxID=1981511 RepID=A0A329QHP8_9ACTN|nr:methionine ABC transporter ATP-binding protein [Phytoactinopolyspora halophila]AYY14393.1 methionine ABC transporter ATP-binding protein [Actinobacteria bacterium YIM 96077]RAW11885.1 methionine ABC transporter ATP-binding protein [Phytoactinopolyspora halophila]
MISFREATKVFGSGPDAVRAVDSVTLDVGEGEIFGVIGYSGAGKSTLVRLVNALETVTSGQVVVDGHDVTTLGESELRQLRASIGMVFQQFNLMKSRTVAGNVAYPLKVARWPKERRKQRVAELLDFVGLADKARTYPGQLSGGQKQRVGIARALATSPKILLADEATSALDPDTTQDVLALLKRVNRELGVTVVVITHEMDVIRSIAQRVAVMEHGKVVEHGRVYDVFAAPRERATRRFVGTALRDRPTPEVLERLRHRHPGRMVTVGVRDGQGSGTDLTATLRRHGVDGSIVFGGITEIDERPFGSLTVELAGDEESIDALIAELRRTADVHDLGTREHPRNDPSAVVAGDEQPSSPDAPGISGAGGADEIAGPATGLSAGSATGLGTPPERSSGGFQ